MSVLINMEMPTSCAKCKLFGEYGCPFIGAVGYALTRGKRNEDCPLAPVQPHGRLIDADVLMKEMDKQENAMFEHGREFTFSFKSGGDVCTAWYNVEMMVEDAPTIIQASEEGE